MAPGVFCIWSRTDPDTVAKVNADETFSDAVTELPGVSVGMQVSLMEKQVMEYPYSHDIPFLTIYDLPDLEYRNDGDFKEVEKACQSRGDGVCKPRFYEEVFKAEVPGCEKIHPQLGDHISIVTAEAPAPEDAEDFWKWHKESFMPLFMESSTFLRGRVLREVPGEPRTEKPFPSAPYLWIMEFEDDGLPWFELTSAAQSNEWHKYLERDLIWQGMSCQVKRFSKKFEETLSSGGTHHE